MTQDFSSLRTTEDIINALSVLYFNLNEIERNYYDIFINPKSMTVNLQRYNELGVLDTVPVKNLASLQTAALTGVGSPDGVVSAEVGKFYIDTSDYSLYFKSSGNDSYGWVLIWSALNLKENDDYLAPDGSAPQLRDLNMDNASLGTLAVERGGTGTGSITGIIKGNGTASMTAAVDGVDYLGGNSFVGIVAYYPVRYTPQGLNAIPTGWLICDGSAYSRSTYERLYNKIGNTYGAGDGSTTFNVPNLMNDGNGNPFFIRCWDGSSSFNTVQQGQVGVHNHPLNGNTGSEKDHVHKRGNMEITGSFNSNGDTSFSGGSGALSVSGSGGKYAQNWYGSPAGTVTFKASNGWSGVTSGPFTDSSGTEEGHSHSLEGLSTGNNSTGTNSNETRVLNKMLIPIIKY